jgi:hypothetical protein
MVLKVQPSRKFQLALGKSLQIKFALKIFVSKLLYCIFSEFIMTTVNPISHSINCFLIANYFDQGQISILMKMFNDKLIIKSAKESALIGMRGREALLSSQEKFEKQREFRFWFLFREPGEFLDLLQIRDMLQFREPGGVPRSAAVSETTGTAGVPLNSRSAEIDSNRKLCFFRNTANVDVKSNTLHSDAASLSIANCIFYGNKATYDLDLS